MNTPSNPALNRLLKNPIQTRKPEADLAAIRTIPPHSLPHPLPSSIRLPEYNGNSILNLMSTVIRARGGLAPHRELAALPAAELKDARKVVYLVLDGLGASQLREHLGGGHGMEFFARHAHDIITSVFPATTAAAVTTFATGASPSEHAIIGWHLNLPDLGLVSTILPAITRTRTPVAPPDFNLKAYLSLPCPIETAGQTRVLLSWGHIPASRYSNAGPRWHRRIAFQTVAGMARAIVSFARSPGRGLAYAYWPEYDSLCHEYGCGHRKVALHFARLDKMLAGLTRALAGTGTTLLVTADHGLIDAPPAHRVELRDVPGLLACLATLPAGDARQVHCFVRPSMEPQFLSIVRHRLGKACFLVQGKEAIRCGWFGPGKPHPALSMRCGDYLLIARGNYAFGTRLPGQESDFNEANHGGISAREMLVPLFTVRS